MMDPACEINEKGTREKNDRNEVIEEGTSTPLDLDPNEADDETLLYAEEDWQDPEQNEVPKNLKPDLPFTIQTRQNDRKRSKKTYNPYGDDFVVDRIDLKKDRGARGSHVADRPDQHLGARQPWGPPQGSPVDGSIWRKRSTRPPEHPNMRVMRWRNGALSGSDLANEPGLGSSKTYRPGEMPMPSKPMPGLTRMHREMNSEAASSGSPLRAAVPPKRAKVEQGVQTNQTMQDLDGMKDELERSRKELGEVTKTMLITEEDRDMWKKLFEDCNKKQGEEIERLRRDYKERSERVALTTAVEKVIPERSIPRGQSPMELLTPREMSQTTETRPPAKTGRVTIPDPSNTLGDPVVEQTARKLRETAGPLVANENAPGSGVTALYGTIDDTGRVRLSQSVMTRQGVSDTTPPMGSSKVPERRIRKMPAKKLSRVIDVQKNNQLKYNFTGVPEADSRACFNRATWNAAVNLQQPPLGTSHLILRDSLVRVLSNLSTFWVTTVMAFGGATIAHLFRMVELINPGRIANVMILVGTNNISRSSDEEEAL